MDTCINCGCEPQSPDCREKIACSQLKVAECEAKLFCDVVSRLGCEIRHARCLRDLDQLVRITNSFLNASAVKETAIAEVLASLGESEDGVLCE
jgi:hypothetical protein